MNVIPPVRYDNALMVFCVAFAMVAVMFASLNAQAQGPAAKPPVPAAKPPQSEQAKPAAAAAAAVPDTQPVAHARGAAVSTCMPALAELSRLTVDAPHAALSTWNKNAVNEHSFTSIVGLKYENEQAPRAVSILTVAPNKAQRCDGSTVQVQPSALSCEVIAKNLLQTQKTAAVDVNGVTVVQGDGPLRIALLPTQGNGCTVVGISTYFARP